jgi:hypothetical protein
MHLTEIICVWLVPLRGDCSGYVRKVLIQASIFMQAFILIQAISYRTITEAETYDPGISATQCYAEWTSAGAWLTEASELLRGELNLQTSIRAKNQRPLFKNLISSSCGFSNLAKITAKVDHFT